uniref:Uncharacterized protein LOC105060324 n=1 Tax=Elaeis guineensis var. tenera TaxID=51953 RepID=A0A6I9SF22_ELAGV|nr:uncharacterized protein LOC105060324 [Elaeis guineensis]
MAAEAAHVMLQSVFDGCIAFFDNEIRRRPYHRNCSCALHQSGGLPKDLPCNTKVSYPIRRSWGASVASSRMLAGHSADGQGFLKKREESLNWSLSGVANGHLDDASNIDPM